MKNKIRNVKRSIENDSDNFDDKYVKTKFNLDNDLLLKIC